MKQLQPVLWTRGVLLAPQHLQTQDRFLEDSIEFRLSALTFCRWGFQRLSLDEEALAAGNVRVTDAAGLFPDGLLFDFPMADAAPPPRSILEAWRPDQSVLSVYLAVPEYRDGGWNVATSFTDTAARYVSETVLARDENTGEVEKSIEVGRKNLRLIVGDEPRDGYSTLPVARILRAANGAMQLDPYFVPPLVDFAASSYLTTIAGELLERLSARGRALSELRRQRNQKLADFGITGIANFWLLYTVNGHLPIIKHLLETRRGHPSQLFEVMLGLAGALTTFSAELAPANLPVYDHNDLGGSFRTLARDVFTLLDTVVPRTTASIALVKSDGRSVHQARLDDECYVTADELFLAVRADVQRTELLSLVPSVKVGAFEQIDYLVKQSLPGLGLSHATRLPDGVPLKLEYEYFRIDRNNELWRGIAKSRTFAVHVPAALRDPHFELVAVLARE
jgi:type VI secretion system protein ImpJ